MNEVEEHKRNCLARWICNLGDVKTRRGFINRLERRNGKMIADDIRRRVMTEWENRRGRI